MERKDSFASQIRYAGGVLFYFIFFETSQIANSKLSFF